MMGRPRRIIVPLDAVATDTRTEALASPLAAVEPEPAPEAIQRTPERQRLAVAIETVRALEAEIRDASAAIDPTREAVWAAQRVLDDAEEMLNAARPRETFVPAPTVHSYWGSQAEADEAARRARAAAEAPPISVADAKAAVEVAKDSLDTAKRLRQFHEDKQRNAEQRLQSRRGDIRAAVRAVLRAEPAVLALAMECRRLKTRAEATRQVFGDILWGDVVQPGSLFYGWDQIADAHSSPDAMADWSVKREWDTAVEALATDPDAPLPLSA